MTDFLQITDMVESQASKYLTHNQANHRLAVMAQICVIDRDLTAPPGSPSNGQVYIPKATATGAWAGKENYVAIYDNGWIFLLPAEGWRAFVQDEDVEINYNGSAWKLKHPEKVVQTITCADNVTIDWSLGGIGKMTFDRATVAFTFSGAVDGQKCQLLLKQDATGGRTVTFGSEVRGSDDLPSPPTLSTGANKLDRLGYVYNGTDSKYDFVAINKGY